MDSFLFAMLWGRAEQGCVMSLCSIKIKIKIKIKIIALGMACSYHLSMTALMPLETAYLASIVVTVHGEIDIKRDNNTPTRFILFPTSLNFGFPREPALCGIDIQYPLFLWTLDSGHPSAKHAWK